MRRTTGKCQECYRTQHSIDQNPGSFPLCMGFSLKICHISSQFLFLIIGSRKRIKSGLPADAADATVVGLHRVRLQDHICSLNLNFLQAPTFSVSIYFLYAGSRSHPLRRLEACLASHPCSYSWTASLPANSMIWLGSDYDRVRSGFHDPQGNFPRRYRQVQCLLSF